MSRTVKGSLSWKREWVELAYSYFADGFEIVPYVDEDALYPFHNLPRLPILWWYLFDFDKKQSYKFRTLRECKQYANHLSSIAAS